MDKLLTELEKARGLVGFDPAMAANEIVKHIELEQFMIDSGNLDPVDKHDRQMAIIQLRMLNIILRGVIV